MHSMIKIWYSNGRTSADHCWYQVHCVSRGSQPNTYGPFVRLYRPQLSHAHADTYNTRHRCSSRTGTLTPSGGDVRHVLWVRSLKSESIHLSDKKHGAFGLWLVDCLQSLLNHGRHELVLTFACWLPNILQVLSQALGQSVMSDPDILRRFWTGSFSSQTVSSEAEAWASATLTPRLTCYLTVCRTQALLALKSCYPGLVYSLQSEKRVSNTLKELNFIDPDSSLTLHNDSWL